MKTIRTIRRRKSDGTTLIAKVDEQGMRQGLSRLIGKNGTPIASIQYKNDKRHGIGMKFNGLGLPYDIAVFKNGKLIISMNSDEFRKMFKDDLTESQNTYLLFKVMTDMANE